MYLKGLFRACKLLAIYLLGLTLLACGEGNGSSNSDNTIDTEQTSIEYTDFTLVKLAEANSTFPRYGLWMIKEGGTLKQILDYFGNDDTLIQGYKFYYVSGTDIYVIDDLLLDEIIPRCVTCGITLSDIDNLTVFKDRVYFSASDSVYGNELWVTDGTSEGTFLLKDINTQSSNDSSPKFFQVSGEYLFFHAYSDNAYGFTYLWVTDGTSEGTREIDVLESRLQTTHKANFNNKIYFSTDTFLNQVTPIGEELWVSDGSVSGTYLIKDINPGGTFDPPSSWARDFIEFQGKLFFCANDGAGGEEIWTTDGTADGTNMFVNINTTNDPFYGGSHPFYLTINANKMYFSADDEHGQEPWVTDGTVAGTFMLKDLRTTISPSGINLSSQPQEFMSHKDLMFFSANTDDFGRELFVTDGTSTSTTMVKDIRIDPLYGSAPKTIASLGELLYFSADMYGDGNYYLWSTDGTESGTKLVSKNGIYFLGSL